MTQLMCSVHRSLRWNIFITKLSDFFLCFSSWVPRFNLVKLPIPRCKCHPCIHLLFCLQTLSNWLLFSKSVYFSPVLLAGPKPPLPLLPGFLLQHLPYPHSCLIPQSIPCVVPRIQPLLVWIMTRLQPSDLFVCSTSPNLLTLDSALQHHWNSLRLWNAHTLSCFWPSGADFLRVLPVATLSAGSVLPTLQL